MTPEEIEREQEMEREVERRLQERLRAMQLPATTQAGDGTAVADGQNATAIAARGVSAEQAEIIITGDNNTVNLLITQVKHLPLSAEKLRQEIGRYLYAVISANRTITLNGIQDPHDPHRKYVHLDLDTVYVPLQAQAIPEPTELPQELTKQDAKGQRLEQEPREIALDKVLELGRHLAITGGPGCGKSTVLMYMAWVLASALATDNPALVRQKLSLAPPLPLPILMPINRYADYLRQLPAEQRHQRSLAAFLNGYLHEKYTLPENFFHQLLEKGEYLLLLLDGLDEVPTETERQLVTQRVQDLVRAHPQVRVVVTCRTAAYQGIEQFREVRVLPLTETHIATLVGHAYRFVYALSPERQASQTADLLAGIRKMEAARRERLGEAGEPLVNSPLLVRMMLIVHISERKLPDQRAELYLKATLNLLNPTYAIDHDVQEDISRMIGGDRALEMVQFIAYHMHERGEAQGREIDEQPLKEWLTSHPSFADLAEPFLSITRQRGTVMEAVGRQYRFIHLGFQELLVARYIDEVLLRGATSPHEVLGDKLTDSWWREPILLLPGYGVASQNVSRAEQIIRYLIGEGEALDRVPTPVQWQAAELAAIAVREWPSAPPTLRQQVTQRLLNLLEEESQHQQKPSLQKWWGKLTMPHRYQPVPARIRANVGMSLGQLGDPRRGVGIVVRADGLKIPEIAWGKAVPAGKYTIGDKRESDNPVREIAIAHDYQLAKYPVTYAQFQCFVEAEDYGDARWWVGMPEEENSFSTNYKTYITKQLSEQAFPYANHPRERVSWYQAVAFCRWLSDKLGDEVRLPYEQEWEVAARYNDDRTYPWGNEFDKDKANTAEGQLQQTTAVGLYPNGRQPHLDLYDLSGNVWEWCQDGYGLYGIYRVVRGGTWDSYQVDHARAVARDYDHPSYRYNSVGVRVVRVPRPPSLLGH